MAGLKTYSGQYLDEVAMPLGGIGTGTVSLGGRGDLRDWEIMNRGALGFLPAFKLVLPTIANGPFFALYYKQQDREGKVRVLEGPVQVKEYYGDWGADAVNSGFPGSKRPLLQQPTLLPRWTSGIRMCLCRYAWKPSIP